MPKKSNYKGKTGKRQQFQNPGGRSHGNGTPQTQEHQSSIPTLQNYADFNNAQLGEFIVSGTITIAASNRKRLEVATTLHNTLTGLATAIQGSQVVCSKYDEKTEFISSHPFSVTPIIVLLENGEVPNNVDSNSHYLNEVLELSLPNGQQSMYKTLPRKESKMNPLGTYTVKTNVPLLKPVNRWLQDFYKKELAEITTPYLYFYVLYLVCGQASQTITRNSIVSNASFTKPRGVTKSFL